MLVSPEQAAFNQTQVQKRSDAVANAICSAIPDSERLAALDYGCGPGHIGLRLAGDFRRMFLADSDPDAVASAADASRGLDNVSSLVLDLSIPTALPPDLRVDVVFSCLSWHHVRDLDHLLDTLPIIAPGGRLMVVDMDADGGAYHADLPGFDGVHGFDRDELRERLTSHGYTDVTIADVWASQKWVAGTLTDLSLFMLQARIPPVPPPT
ncbi:MAG: class I SAM-dependent methyltransferase [Propionibacteriaceae bacterium]|nr:class I SAM-dependent methyltransferase [Propionibacteriaceae bacterium]